MKHTTLISTLLVIIILSWNGVTVGQSMPPLIEVEQQVMSNTLQYALEYNKTNQAANWENPGTSRTGAVVPVRTFVDVQGRPCREFITTVTINGRQQRGNGTACRQPNGVWYVLSDRSPARVPIMTGGPVYTYHPVERHYVPPYTYYNPFHINFSFSYLFRGGSLRFSNYYPSGLSSLYFGSYYPRIRPMWYPRTHWPTQRYRSYRPLHNRPYSRPHRRR